jgi:hypothetical protein
MSDSDYWSRVDVASEPLFWLGNRVWIRSLGREGIVTANLQNSARSDLNTMTVVTVAVFEGRRVAAGGVLELTMQEAMDDLVPGIRYLIEERP